jgi:C4-dicarboxylate transporter DctM subunit
MKCIWGGRMARAVGNIYWEKSIDFLLLSAPLFIMLGEIMLRAGIARKMYNAVAQWLTWLPGGLMHANIATSALFAATSGSSVATTATIGVAAYPEIERHKYNEPLFMGSIAAGGTLGILIPPSVGLILFGILTETSIPELYLAGFLPRHPPGGRLHACDPDHLPSPGVTGTANASKHHGRTGLPVSQT